MADHCNKRKTEAKAAGDDSARLYMCVFIGQHGPFEEDGVIFGVMDRSFDVLIARLCVEERVYCENLPIQAFDYNEDETCVGGVKGDFRYLIMAE